MPPKRSHLSSTTTSPIPCNQSNAKTMPTLNHDRYPITEHGRSLVKRHPISHFSPLLRPPAFDKLPMELIYDIFSLACPKVVLDLKSTIVPFHFRLGRVCKKWRAIVAAHRALWAAFEIDVRGDWNPKLGVYLRNYLQQSGTYPLTIQVWATEGDADEGPFNVLDAIMPHCERWATIKLEFCLDYRFLQKLEAVRDRLPLLQRLRITGSIDRYPTITQNLAIFFHNAPSLTRLSVFNISKDSDRMLALPWSRVSRASLDSASFRKIQSSLELSQTLTTLTLTEGYLNHSFTPVLLRSPATLKKLQVLRVRDKINVGHLTCPSLKRLEVYNENVSAIYKLLENSSCSLEHLDLQGFGKGSLFRIISHASLASLTFLRLEDHWVTDIALDLLILDSHMLLPHLETLYVDINFEFDSMLAKENMKSQIGSLRRIVESRTHDHYGSKGSLAHLNDATEHKVATPLKKCHFLFRENQGGWDKWADRALQCLRSFCKSRDVLAVLIGLGTPQELDNCPCQCNENRCYHVEDSDSEDGDNSDNNCNYNNSDDM